MWCLVAGYDALARAAHFVRKIKQGRQGISALPQRASDFPAYESSHRHRAPASSSSRNQPPIPEPAVHFEEDLDPDMSPPRYRNPGAYVPDRRDQDARPPLPRRNSHPRFARAPPPAPNPPPLGPHRQNPLRGGGEDRGYDYDSDVPAPAPAAPPPPPRYASPVPSVARQIFAIVYRRSPADAGVEIRPASISSSFEGLQRQARSHWNLPELRLFGNVDGLKMNLNSQSDLEAYVKLCEGTVRLIVEVE
ncbi:hypothetical protein L873DRAFT_1662627 [Choiromyces venosus 120613-1]|uniref:Uncharacterized protein n=1 Tax=Choiromyces venosus 120613-1 TaxID=1336337 RepID=A0A3N4K7K8_9PEZI|nr:hypothetical protein L873DRAFT_1662627 [Choiromyces venosus 120613-1]